MKLQLKHLTPYLPYGLKMCHNLIPTQLELIGIFYEQFKEGIYCLQFKDKKMLTPMSACKPILKPLSGWHEIENATLFFSEFFKSMRDMDGGIEHNLFSATYYDLQLLFVHHYDVFGLIEQGLAIDINTL